MLSETLIGLLLILAAAVWRAISVKRRTPKEKHSFTEYTDAFFFPEEDSDERREK